MCTGMDSERRAAGRSFDRDAAAHTRVQWAQVAEGARGGEGVAPLAPRQDRTVDTHRDIADTLHGMGSLAGELPSDRVTDLDGDGGGGKCHIIDVHLHSGPSWSRAGCRGRRGRDGLLIAGTASWD